MPIISKIGRRSWGKRLLIGAVYALLIAGSVTMIYPFLLLVSGSTKSGVDTPQAVVVPPFLRSETELFRKYAESYFNEDQGVFGAVCLRDKPFFEFAAPPAAPAVKLVAEWRSFLEQAKLPPFFYMLSCMDVQSSRGVCPSNLRAFKAEMGGLFGGDIAKLNASMDKSFTDWSKFKVRQGNYVFRTFRLGDSPWDMAFREFKESSPLEQRIYFSVPGTFSEVFLKARYANEISALNAAWKSDAKEWASIRLPRQAPPPSEKAARADWEIFVRDMLGLPWLRLDVSDSGPYREFLKAKYDGDLKALNARHGASYGSFDMIEVCGEPPEKGVASSDWISFLQGWHDPDTGKTYKAPLESIRIHCVDFLFQDYLKVRYGDIAKADSALGASFKVWSEIAPPQFDALHLDFMGRKASITWEFCARNFITVADYLILHGNALFNTAVYCLLTILSSLIVNPLAAYALSRFKPPSAYKVLLFLMLTMAFPPVVTQIPNFLMLRDLGLLNSYSALILPCLANGYSIFLLKGFFDSLPQELYESASLDGAGEVRIFLQITMSLSKPILAVIALSAFTAAYGNFMMALLVCQDRDMWTIMPFLFELQQNSCQGLVFASLLVAAIPTLIIFTFCQNIIMRGIVVPVEK